MDWIKLLRAKIYDRRRFLTYLFLLILLISYFLASINLFILNSSVSSLWDFKSIVDSARDILTKKDIWIEPILIVLFGLLILWFAIFLEEFLEFVWRVILSEVFPSWDLNKDFNFECFNDLEIQGNVSNINKSLILTSSSYGILLKHRYWKDFRIGFKFNFNRLKTDKNTETNWIKINDKYQRIDHKPKNNFFGLLFRAQDLNNYFMISIGIKQIIKEELKNERITDQSYDQKVLITPHVRVDGNWDVFENIKFNKNDIKIRGNNHVVCEVKGNVLTLNIGKALKDYKWIIPSKFRLTWESESNKSENDRYSFGDSTTIPFRNSFGMIGFRAYGEERVTIKNIIITRL